MNRTRHFMPVFLAVILIAACGSLLAQTGTPVEPASDESTAPSAATTSETSTISGEVVSRTDDSLVIMSDDGMRMTFVLNQDTASESAPPEQTGPGERVSLQYRRAGDGSYLATQVTLDTAAGSPPRAEAAAMSAGSEETPTMPHTAGSLPVFVLIGTLAVGAAAGLTLFARRAA